MTYVRISKRDSQLKTRRSIAVCNKYFGSPGTALGELLLVQSRTTYLHICKRADDIIRLRKLNDKIKKASGERDLIHSEEGFLFRACFVKVQQVL